MGDGDGEYIRLRTAMVEDQIIRRGVNDPGIIRAMKKVPRHLFVPETSASQAYQDCPLPIGLGQTISQPYMVAIMTQALKMTGEEEILEIGTGSGYQAAVLAEIAAQVFTLERLKSLQESASARLSGLGYENIFCRCSDGTMGWPGGGTFDGIIVTAGGPRIPSPLLDQLKPGGRLVIPVGDRDSQILIRVIHTSGGYRREDLGACRFVRLIGAEGWGH